MELKFLKVVLFSRNSIRHLVYCTAVFWDVTQRFRQRRRSVVGHLNRRLRRRLFATGNFIKKKALLIKFKRTVLIHSLLTSLVCQKKRHKAFSCNSYRRLSSNLKLNFLYCVVSFFLFVLTSSNLLQKSNLLTFVKNMFCRCTGQQELLPLLGKFIRQISRTFC